MIDVIPGILEKDWGEIERKIELVAPYVSWVQIDVCDNTLVPNTTFLDFAKFFPATKSRYSEILSHLSLEAHLMVAEPHKYIRILVDAGFRRLVAHVEAHDPRLFLDQARYESVEVGIAIDGQTELREVEPFLDSVDCVLVMMYEAGFSGQPFQPENLEKVYTIHGNFPDLPIAVDGGISDQTAKAVKEAGATRLVSTSFLFKDPTEIAAAIESLKNA